MRSASIYPMSTQTEFHSPQNYHESHAQSAPLQHYYHGYQEQYHHHQQSAYQEQYHQSFASSEPYQPSENNYSMQSYQAQPQQHHQQPNQTWNISQNKSSYIVSRLWELLADRIIICLVVANLMNNSYLW